MRASSNRWTRHPEDIGVGHTSGRPVICTRGHRAFLVDDGPQSLEKARCCQCDDDQYFPDVTVELAPEKYQAAFSLGGPRAVIEMWRNE